MCIAVERGEGNGVRTYGELRGKFLREEQWTAEVTLWKSTGANHCERNGAERGQAFQGQVYVPLRVYERDAQSGHHVEE